MTAAVLTGGAEMGTAARQALRAARIRGVIMAALGIVAAALLFGALRTGGGLMQVKTGIPLDLLFFIQALVIMFVAAPDLVRSIWRLGGTRTPTGTVVEGAKA